MVLSTSDIQEWSLTNMVGGMPQMVPLISAQQAGLATTTVGGSTTTEQSHLTTPDGGAITIA